MQIKKFMYIFCIIYGLFLVHAPHLTTAVDTQGKIRAFSQFEIFLPDGWDGDEKSGFITDNREEYVISLARKDANEDRYISQVSIYILPNPEAYGSEEAAKILAQAQADSTQPVQEGNFWLFQGEPRTNIVHGLATTMVSTTPKKMLIIIAQDENKKEAEAIVKSLKALNPEAQELLGR